MEDKAKVLGTVAQWAGIFITIGSLVAGGLFGMGQYRADMDYLKTTTSKIDPVAQIVTKLKSDLDGLQHSREINVQKYEAFKDKTEDRLTGLEALIPVVREQLSEIKNDVKELKGRKEAGTPDNLEHFR